MSTYRYPILTQVSLETVVEYLLQAPKITRELAAMNWMFLNAPADGSVMLVWQPLNQLGTQFASDGYVWADVEQAFSSEAKGYVCDLLDCIPRFTMININNVDCRDVHSQNRLPSSKRNNVHPLQTALSLDASQEPESQHSSL